MGDNTNCKFKKEIMILPSRCDYLGHLSVPDCFAVFMDIATEHAELLGIGSSAMVQKNLFWLTVKTIIKIKRLPFLSEKVIITTWPEKPEGFTVNRDYLLSKNGEVLVEGKTQWALFDTKNKKLQRADNIYPNNLILSDEKVLDEPFRRIDESIGCEPFAEYKVKSTDIDIGGHMNNVAYIRALFSLFSSEEMKNMNHNEIEVVFKSPCFEGEHLIFKKITQAGCTTIIAYHGDGTITLVVSMR